MHYKYSECADIICRGVLYLYGECLYHYISLLFMLMAPFCMSTTCNRSCFEVSAYMYMWLASVFLMDALYIATLHIFQNGPHHLWCSYHLFPYGSCMIPSPGSELFDCQLLDLGPLVGSYYNHTGRGTTCMELCLDLWRGGGICAEWCITSL